MKTNTETTDVKTASNIKSSTPVKNAFRLEYNKHAKVRRLVVGDLKKRVEKILVNLHSSPTVSERIKSFDSYYKKYLRFKGQGKTPQIMDIIGLRIISPFHEDIKKIEKLIDGHFEIVENEVKSHDSFSEFAYESIHLLIKIPQDIIAKRGNPGAEIAEIQIRTILQDAWAEVEHQLAYKANTSSFDEPMRHKLAAVNASLYLADIVFQELRSHQRRLTGELNKRRESIHLKIEREMDEPFFEREKPPQKSKPPVHDIAANPVSAEPVDPLVYDTGLDLVSSDNMSIDNLLVNALTAHNQERFDEAITLYTQILELHPDKNACAIVHNHRGMAYFACSRYSEAIDDFTRVLENDKNSYKAAYYRGVVRAINKQHAQAIDDYSLSLSIEPYQTFCLLRRGQAYYHIGDYPQALSDCEKSLALDPENEAAVNFINMLREKLKM